ncbi:glycosyltransferase family 4 protein [Alsobacter sp. SYSU BS001988]
MASSAQDLERTADASGRSAPVVGAAGELGSRVAVNMRAAAFETGGQQRMTLEIMKRLPEIGRIAPRRALRGVKGHAWEQLILPLLAQGRLLWSPSATGPAAYPKQIVTLHDVAFFDIPEFFAPSFLRAYQTLIPMLVRRVAHVVTVSAFSRQRIIDRLGVPEDKVSIIYNGVSPSFGPRAPSEIDAVKKAFGVEGRYVLLHATSDPRKNLGRALQAWRGVVDRAAPDLELVVFGLTGRAHVFGQHEDLSATPRVRRLGYVADEAVPALIAGAELFLFPSLYEGFGLPIIEAMRCGAPVLTSAATSTQEIAADAALCVDPTSAEAIGRGVLALLENPELRARFVERGFRRAADFDWDDAARAYGRLFERFAG